MIMAYIPCKNRREAESISKALLSKKLIACANIFPARSFYWWNGKIDSSYEAAIIAKSFGNKQKAIIEHVEKIHSYDIPCIEFIKSSANKKYEDWARKEIK